MVADPPDPRSAAVDTCRRTLTIRPRRINSIRQTRIFGWPLSEVTFLFHERLLQRRQLEQESTRGNFQGPGKKQLERPRGGGADAPRSVAPAAPVVDEGLALELPAWDPGLRPPTRQGYRPGPSGHLTSGALQQSSRRTGASLQKIVRRDNGYAVLVAGGAGEARSDRRARMLLPLDSFA